MDAAEAGAAQQQREQYHESRHGLPSRDCDYPVACKIAPIPVIGGPPVSRLPCGPDSRCRGRARRRARCDGSPRPRSHAPSANVAALQVALRAERVYAGGVDGVAGPATRAAVRRVQRRQGLTSTASPARAPAARSAAAGARGSAAGRWPLRARGWDVAALQFLLARHGFPSGAVDGGLGARTDAALRRFQAWAGLGADGVAGPGTLAALRRSPPRSPLRFLRPVGGVVGSWFGPRGTFFHPGLDFEASTGAPVRAGASGCVTFAGRDRGGYGKLVVLRHGLGDDELVRAPVADRGPARAVRRPRVRWSAGSARPARPPARTCTSSCACAAPRSTPRG